MNPGPEVDVVIPVFNQERNLAASVTRLHAYLTDAFPFTWCITVVDNASKDATPAIAAALAESLPGVRWRRLERKGRGFAVREAWTASDGGVVAYMDVDLSTGLEALLPLVAPLVSGHSDLAIGSRLATGSRVVRGPKRESISRLYNLLLRTTLGVGFSDAQCGFKAMRADLARQVLPFVEDDGWFFDTELLVVAESNGLRVHEVPVDWIEDVESRVDIVRTARTDLRGVVRMRGRLRRGATDLGAVRPAAPAWTSGTASELVRFAGVGAASTAIFAVLLALVAPRFGVAVGALLAMALSTALNAAIKRRIANGVPPRSWPGRRARRLASGLPPALTMLAVAVTPGLDMPERVVAVTATSGVGGVARFLVLRWSADHGRRHSR